MIALLVIMNFVVAVLTRGCKSSVVLWADRCVDGLAEVRITDLRAEGSKLCLNRLKPLGTPVSTELSEADYRLCAV